MNALAAERTVEVMLLGRRGRYSLTPQLQRVYLTLVRMIDARGGTVSPSLEELGAELGFGRSFTCVLIADLEERGWLYVVPRVPRGIRLLEPVLRDLKPVNCPRL